MNSPKRRLRLTFHQTWVSGYRVFAIRPLGYIGQIWRLSSRWSICSVYSVLIPADLRLAQPTPRQRRCPQEA